MSSSVLICVVLFSVIINVYSDSGNSKLLSVVQVFRHGERTPIFFYPTDPYPDPKYWNEVSPGILTEVGKRQLFKLGEHFRNRYDSFIGDRYNESDISVRSTDKERNINSAKSFMKALYINEDPAIIISRWPIISTLIMCLKFDIEYLKSESETEEFIKVNKNNRELYDYLNKHTEMPIFGLGTALTIYDILNIESEAKLKLPEWTEAVWPDALQQVARNFTKFFCHTEEQQKLGAGAFLNELLEHFENIINNEEEPRTILYSAHDLNLICFLSAFEFYKTSEVAYPQFASSIIFELRQHEETNHYFVNTFYKHSVEEEGQIPISVRKCDINCKLEDFKESLSHLRITLDEWYKQCFYLP